MVSIIVPVYNIEKYLPQCVKSLLGQSYRDLEILLVNDGSTDGSGELCNSLAASDPRIRAIHKPNGGLSDARNAGLDAAKGQWVLFVDGDDYLAENAVAQLMELAQPDVDFVQFHYYETESAAWQPEEPQLANPQLCTDNAFMWQWLYEKGGVAASSCTKLWNRRVFDSVRFQKGILHEDEELINRVLPQCKKVIYTDLVLYGYMIRGGSIIRSGFRPKSMEVFAVMEARVEVLSSLGYAELVQRTKTGLFQTAAWQYALAKKGGFSKEAAILKQKLLTLAKDGSLMPTGQYKLLYQAAKVCKLAPELYYLIRRVSGKT